ncbi:chemotaxis protein CheB [Pelagicoccus sp. SDUM812005]|uniref:chemotaxis protein CheB n=1 Tax=Pelagicoccus sp. SDUM812005 TaxID=3041257 RepID=UPI00280FB01E|nr:chemotaxis protein CheB [Pelagicoccus sp. SDUM812005]MDQ8180959.1 chemotaxis protein CheB [Pelagicoccus sp. SDUM812005]
MQSPDDRAFPIIGIGASAGGLEALQVFFSNVNPQFEAAYVLIQHLSPDFESKMDELLARKVALPISVASDNVLLETGNIYLMPPRHEMVISDGRLRLMAIDNSDHLSLPIDHFFKSLAQEAGSRAVAVVLSGTGTDGSRGIKHVHDAGGFVVVQTNETAKFSGMLVAAMETGKVDAQLDPEAIPRAIMNRAMLSHGTAALDDNPEFDLSTRKVLETLKSHFGIDFSQYNPSMILRRINRRMVLDGNDSPENFIRRLEEDPERISDLYQDLLIGVSSFFRDPDAMQSLDKNTVAPLVDAASDHDEIRVWVEGCAAGQEAYTLGILFLERIRVANKRTQLKIFATDVHKESLEVASRGTYEADEIECLDPELQERYFEQAGEKYRAKESLRSVIVFAIHNALVSPPFTRMDLISCRNMLIYFKPAAKKKVLSLFHFGLKRDGYLFLGSSESPFGHENEFVTVDKRAKIYKKIEATRTTVLPSEGRTFNTFADYTPLLAPGHSWEQKINLNHTLRTYETLLENYMPRSLLIDSDYTILHSFKGAEAFVRLPPGRATVKVPDCLPRALKNPVSAVLRRAKTEDGPTRLLGIEFESADGLSTLDITAQQIFDVRTKSTRFLIAFESREEPIDKTSSTPTVFAPEREDHVKSLEDELSTTQESLNSAIEELEASNEELQATNEELVASNEELQSTNEELQSVNEELHSVNAEHQQKILELSDVTADLEGLLRTSEVGVFFLDSALRLKRFTPLVAQLFHLHAPDIGRSLEDFTTDLRYPDLIDDLKTACDGQSSLERQVSDKSGTPYLVRILPHYVDGQLHGVVGTIVDISSIKEAEDKARLLSSIVENSEDAILTLSLEGKINSWNPGATKLFGFTPEESIGEDPRNLIASTDEQKEEISRYISQIREGKNVTPFHTTRKTKSGRLVHVSVQVSPLYDELHELTGISVTDRDITDLHESQEQVRRTAVESRVILENLSEGVLRINEAGICLNANPQAVRILNLDSLKDVIGKPLDEVFRKTVTDDSVNLKTFTTTKSHTKSGGAISRFVVNRVGEAKSWVEMWTHPIESEGGCVISLIDISLRIEAEKFRDWLTTVVHSSRDLIGSADPDGIVTFMNPGGRKMLELGPDEDITAHRISDFHDPETFEHIRKVGIPAAMKSGHWNGNTTVLTRSGKTIPISQSIFAHRDKEGATYAISTICRDISESAAYERALLESEAESRRYATALSSVIDNIPDILLVLDRKLELEFASQNARSLMNTLGRETFLPPEIEKLAEQVLSTRKPYIAHDYTGVIQLQFGKQRRYLLPRIQPNFGGSGPKDVTGVTLLLQDVTEFRLLDEVKSNLLSTVSHELKTPVTSIRMALLLMLEEKEKLDEVQLTLVSTASDETERLLRTLNSLLDLTRFEEGDHRLELSEIKPGELIKDVLNDFASAIRMQGNAIRVSVDEAIPSLQLDLQHMKHTLGNLIGNAIKHSPSGSTIYISCELHGDDQARFSVTDEGQGVPEEFQDKVFDRFFKSPGNSKPGTGLGLSIAREFVIGHRGSIGVKNIEGKGASFFFIIPFRQR